MDIRRLFLVAWLMAAMPAAHAQTYHDTNGTTVPATVVLPYPYTPLGPAQYALAISSSTALTVPTGARFANVCAATANVNYTTDGKTTPTSSVGETIYYQTACIQLSGPLVLANFRAISASGTISVEYFQ